MRVYVVLSTTPDLKSARKIARVLVQKKLAACVSFCKGWESAYCWKEKRVTSHEVLLLAKTVSHRLKTLEATIIQNHPYEVPEILFLPVKGGSTAYLGWIQNSLLDVKKKNVITRLNKPLRIVGKN